MRAAALRPRAGTADAHNPAADGGRDVPGKNSGDFELPVVGMGNAGPHEPIPGERDEQTLTHREPGAIGGAFNGQDNMSTSVGGLMDEQTLRDRLLEGGGAEAARRLDKRGGR